MLIQIEGSIIDTEKIYKINKYPYAIYIYFLDKKEPITIYRNSPMWMDIILEYQIKDVPEKLGQNEAQKIADIRKLITEQKINKAYEQLLSYWNKSKSPIPEIKID